MAKPSLSRQTVWERADKFRGHLQFPAMITLAIAILFFSAVGYLTLPAQGQASVQEYPCRGFPQPWLCWA